MYTSVPNHQEALDRKIAVVCERPEKNVQQQSRGNGALGERCEQLGHVAGLPGLPASLNFALHAQYQIAFAVSH